MFEIDVRSRIPIYEQLKDCILNYIALGILNADDRLPSIRQISADSSVNVNTVKRAFCDLERDGIIYTVAGKGCFVSPGAKENSSAAKKALTELEPYLVSAKNKGVKKEELLSLLGKIYGEE